MKLLVISDSHGDVKNLEKICRMHRDADYIIHAGDGATDLWRVTDVNSTIVSVRGNCDIFGNDYPTLVRLQVDDIKIAVTHGHTLDVKYGYGRAEDYVLGNELDLLIFGHTHIPYESTLSFGDGYARLFNPGSVREGSFGLIHIKGSSVLMSHGHL